MENTPFGFGAVEREQTLSDFQLGSIPSQESIPESFMPVYNVDIVMQGKQPCCGSCAGSYLKAIQDAYNPSFTYLWKKIKSIDTFNPNDGTSMDWIMKSINKTGVCRSDLLQGDISLSVETFAMNAGITYEMEMDALNHCVSTYAFSWYPSFEDIKRAIYNHKAVVLLLRIGDECWNPSWQEKDILPLKPGRPIISGHFVLAYGYDKDHIYFYNSWSNNWGRGGIGYFGSDYASRVIEMGTAVDLNGYKFPRDLKVGMTGTDVGILQSFLKKEGLFKVSITSYFGSITEQAVKDFQMKYKDKILTPLGLTSPTGYAGTATLGLLETMYG